ncbi:MAG: transcriptional repressor [Deltaproteobacteria bacterium]|jgi:Fur family ferric uptake transcriptional regulator
MKSNGQFEKANFRALIEGDNLGDIERRLNVIDVFLGTEEHVTLEELMKLLRENGYEYEPDFVRQCMNRWVDLGFAQKKHFDGQPPRYEHRHLGNHHDHIICTKCGKIVEFSNDDMERLQTSIAAREGFHILQHKMEIYGLCTECLKKRKPLLPIAMAKPGERVVIKEVMGGREVRVRLASMGLRTGDRLEIINNNGMGRLIVGHASTRLALGRGIAQKIMVSLDREDQPT